MKPLTILTSLMLLFFTSFSFALVDMNTAGYTNTWVDIQLPNTGFPLRVQRAYRSRTLYDGIFGFGWCSEFETKLTVNKDSTVKVSECGDGLEVTYGTPKTGGADNQFAPLDTKLFANGREVENVVRSKEYYTRTLADGSLQRFDLEGHLTHTYSKTGQFIKFSYKEDQLIEVEDNNSQKLFLKYDKHNKVIKVTGPNDSYALYQYNNADDLVHVEASNGKTPVETYSYEYNVYHNMEKAVWPDKTFVTIKYDNKKDWVTSFTDREQCVENYKYESSKTEPDLHYWATTVKTCGKQVVAKNHYEFWHKKIKGEVHLMRVFTDTNGDKKDIIYEETFFKPKKIIANKIATEYTYYDNGLVKTKSSPGKSIEYQYDPATGKVVQIKTITADAKTKAKLVDTSIFEYDKKGNMITAQRLGGQKVILTYDLAGRIKTIVDNNKKTVNVEYEEKFGKPSVITQEGLGTIKITYNSLGHVDKVESKQGPEMSGQIASTFNNLLDIVAKANEDVYQ